MRPLPVMAKRASGSIPRRPAAISRSLAGTSVLSAAAEARAVELGAVLGFDLVSGKPKLLFSLGQAGRQGVDLSAHVLRLMAVRP